MVNVTATAQSLNNSFTGLGTWIGVCTGTPGNTSTPANEATGGSPAYARQATTWTGGTSGSAAGSAVILNLPAGTYPYMIMCSGSTGNNMVDWITLPTPIVIAAQTAVTVTPSVSTN
jgi:hypothetical protein